MADVRRRGPGEDGRSRARGRGRGWDGKSNARDRGQLIVITALVLAVVLIALALVVNSAIYTENVASRDTGIESGQVQEDRQLIEEDLQRHIDRSNRETVADDWSSVESTFTNGHSHWEGAMQDRASVNGRSVTTSIQSTTEGTHIRQDTSRNFTAGGTTMAGDPDWTVAENVTEAGPFRLDVERSSLLDVDDLETLSDPVDAVSGNAFYVSIENSTGEWKVYVFRDSSSNVYLYTVGPGDDSLTDQFDEIDDGLLDAEGICVEGSTDDTVTLDFREPRFGELDCTTLEFYDDRTLGTDHDIRYRNARTSNLISENDRVTGTYEIVVDVEANREPFYEPGSGERPQATAVIHTATISMEYRSTELYFRTVSVTTSWSVVP